MDIEYIKQQIKKRWYILVGEYKQLLKAGLTPIQIKELIKKSKQKRKK